MITGQNVKNTYVGDGSTRQWNITFDFNDSSQIKFKVNGVDVATNFSLNTVTKVLTYPTVESELDPLTSSQEIEIYRDTSVIQNTEFNNGGLLNAKMIEDGLDKLTMIAQELKNKILGDEEGIVKVLPNGTNINKLTQEGVYFVVSPTPEEQLPKYPVDVERANSPSYYRAVLLDVKGSFQIAYFFRLLSVVSSYTPVCIAMRYCGYYSSGWIEIARNWAEQETLRTYPGNIIYIPTQYHGGVSYFLPNKEFSENDSLTSLTLNNIEDTPRPIEIYFRTGDSFSGITASQIKGWIGSTTLDTNSVYKITITNLIGKIEKVTLVE